FEAGTPDIAGVIALGAAVDYLQGINRDAAEAHERDLLEYAEARVRELPGITLVGTAAQRAGVLSFLIDGTHPHDVGMLLDQQGVAVRTGNHCAQPIMDQLGIPGTIRESFCIRHTRADRDRVVEALVKAKQVRVEEYRQTVQAFDPTSQVVTVTPAALEHFRRQLAREPGKA